MVHDVNGHTIINALYGLLLLGLAAAIWRTGRPRKTSPTVHDVGPDALRLLEDLDAHLDQYAAHLAGLYERSGAPDPAWDAGRERLWDDIRDNHTKGDHTP